MRADAEQLQVEPRKLWGTKETRWIMRWFNNIRMAPKLIGSFVAVALLAALVGGAGLLGLTSERGTLTTITTVSVPNLVTLLQTNAAIGNAIRYTRGAVLTTSQQQ